MSSTTRPRTALVTGASAGIGQAYCRALAARGFDIVAVARRAERLTQLADELQAAHGVRVMPLAIDLGDPAAATTIAARLAASGTEIDVLVNNAGYGVPGMFLSSQWQAHATYINVMLGVVAELCHRLLPGMCARGHGQILNVASVAGFLPGTAGHTLYAASKSWLINFSESLAFEVAAQGVRVCAVCPGFTLSEFHDVTGTRAQVAQLPAWMWMEAEEVVKQSLAASDDGAVVFIPGFINRLIVRLARWCPRRLVHYLAQRESRRWRAAT